MTNQTPNSQLPTPSVAIVHDWLVGGGAERVVMALHEMYPDAPIYTAYCNDSSRRAFKKADIRTSYMQHFPFSVLRKILPVLRQHWFEHLDLRDYDLVISSSGSEAKGIYVRGQKRPFNLYVFIRDLLRPLPTPNSQLPTPKRAKHINYCHSPTHYYWVRYDEYLKNPGVGKLLDPIARLGLKLFVGINRKWDYRAAQRPDVMVANSTCVQKRIRQFYDRDAVVVHPPVDTKRFALSTKRRHGFVVAGRQTPYKRIDLAVAAATLANLPLKVIGNGPDHDKLVAMAGPSVEFLTNVSDSEMPKYFGEAEAFIMANEDDFGIVPVEALATGTPVVAYKAGGALDYITPSSGLFFTHQGSQMLAEALKKASKHPWKPQVISKQAQKFSAEAFKSNMQSAIDDLLKS